MNAPQQKRRRGGQPGNRNALKPVNALSRRVRDLKRRARDLIAAAEAQVTAGRKRQSP